MPFHKPLAFTPADAPRAIQALTLAAALARRAGGEVTAVDVVPEVPWFSFEQGPDPDNLIAEQVRERTEGIRGLVADHCAGLPCSVDVRLGKPFREIIRKVTDDAHDVAIKVGAAAQDQEPWFGSLARHLLRKCPCPVWLLRHGAPATYAHVTVAIDPVPEDLERNLLAQRLVTAALEVADQFGSRVSVLHCWELYGEAWLAARKPLEILEHHIQATDRRIRNFVEQVLEPYGPRLGEGNLHLIHGPTEVVIPAFVAREGVDLLVMGSMGRSGIPGMLIGNTAEQVLNQVQSSVLVFKPEGFESPVK